MKKFLLLTFLSTNIVYGETQDIPVYYGDIKLNLSQQPIIKNGTVLVPFRDIFETLGYSVHYDYVSQSVEGEKDGSIISLYKGSTYANVSGKDYTLSVAPQAINGVTMVPLRFVSEVAGYKVEWNKKDNLNYVKINNFNPTSVLKTDEHLKQEAIDKAVSLYQEQAKAELDAKNKELQAIQNYEDKTNAILKEYRSQWVSATELPNLYNVYATWNGETIIFQPRSSEKILYTIESSPRRTFEKDNVYYNNGIHYQYIDVLTYPIPDAPNGSGEYEIRVKEIVYSIPDLKAKGIIK